LALAQVDLQDNLVIVLIAAFVFNVIAASQDVITDGLAVRVLDADERGLGNGVQVGAYRLGMILGGGLLLWVFAKSNWSTMFNFMAVLLALTIVPVLLLRGPIGGPGEATPHWRYLIAGWLSRIATPGMLGVAGLIFCYRFGDQMVSSLIGPFMRDFGLDKATIAFMKGTVGSATSLAGAFLGGWFTYRVGRRQALLVAGVAQAGTFVLYVAAAAGIGGVSLLWSHCSR
jgi:MFS family permease